MQDAKTTQELWSTVEGSDKQTEWYAASVGYWDKQEASYDGVLGGYGHVSDADIAESDKFLKKVLAVPLRESQSGARRLTAIGEILLAQI